MPKDALTGTEKKGKKAEIKHAKAVNKLSQKDLEKRLPYNESARHALKQVQKGRHLPKYEQVKYKPETKYEAQNLKDIVKDYERAGRGAEKIFAPIQQEALHNFQTGILPSIQAAHGAQAGDVKTSSALRQALSAAGSNLQRSLSSDFAGLQANLAGNLFNARENQRQFGAQFGNQQEQFGAQFGASQNQFGTQNQLAGLNARMQAAGNLSGSPINPQYTGLAQQPSYLAHSDSPSLIRKIMAGGSTAVGGILGGMAGGPAGAAAGVTAGNAIGQLYL